MSSSYPAPIEEANMAMIPDFKEKYKIIPGLSDLTLGSTVPIVATTLGARIIEKHFILDRSIGGPDASFSMNEEEFTEMVKAVREAQNAIGQVSYELTEKQIKGRAFSRSLDVLNNTDTSYQFTCHFRNGNLDMILNNSWVIHNIKPLIGLPVTRLELQDTSISDIRILKTMPLQYVNLSYAPIKDISSLRDTNIEQLFIRGTRISQLDDLRYMKNLKRIHVDQDISTILETLTALGNSQKIQINPVYILIGHYT